MFTLWYKQRQTLSLFLMAINLLNTATVHVGPRLDNTYSTRYTVNPYPVDNTVCFADTLICWIVIFPVDSIMERYLGQLN